MCVGQYGLRQSHHLAVRRVGCQDVRAHGADIFRERHHQFLADGVDGGVGDLGELLAEVIEKDLRAVTDDGQRRVVAHGCHGLLSGSSHRDDGTVDVLLSIAELDEPPLQMVHAVLHVATALQLLQLHAVLAEPLAVGMGLGQLGLDLAVVVDAALLRVDEQDLARLQSAFADHVARLEIHHAHFRGHHHHTLLRDGIARGAQTVAVEHAARIASVAEEQGGGSVPRLHQYRVVFVEGLQVFADGVLVIKTLRHEDGHGLRQRHAAHDEELKDVVERGRVRHALLDDGRDVADVAQRLARQHALAGLHPASVAADGVDFAVVSQQAEGLGQRPCGECVG